MEKAMVTGAGGFIASWVVKKLLERGITVHGTVRDANNETKTAHLWALDAELPGELTLFEADLLKEGSFDEAAAGCDTIFHLASPFVPFKVKAPQQELIEPAVAGTKNVLHTADRTTGIKNVVLTSSVAAIMGDPVDKADKERPSFSEEDWNESSSLHHQPYSYSKVLAEREAWKIAAAQKQWKLIVINPGFVLGPTLSKRSDSTSTGMVMQFLNGSFKLGVPELSFGIVDVRDVAEAHVRAATFEEAEGRILVSGPVLSMPEIKEIIQKQFPGKFALPTRALPKPMLYLFGPFQGFTWRYIKSNIGHSFKLNTLKSRERLYIKYRTPEETIKDQVDRLMEAGLVEN